MNECWKCRKEAIGYVEVDNGKNLTLYGLCSDCIKEVEKVISIR